VGGQDTEVCQRPGDDQASHFPFGEYATLVGFLEFQRATMAWKFSEMDTASRVPQLAYRR